MLNNLTPYSDHEYQLLVEKLEHLCGKLSNQCMFQAFSRDVIQYSEDHSVNMWNANTSRQFITHLSNKWEFSYHATLVVESVMKELTRSYPQTTFTHIAKTLHNFSTQNSI